MTSRAAPCCPASGSPWGICFCKELKIESPQSASLVSVSAARSSLLTRMAVILHERLGTWSAQLRPRVQGRPVHWIETRSASDLDKALFGLACPVVLIDLQRNVVEGLSDLDRVTAPLSRGTGAGARSRGSRRGCETGPRAGGNSCDLRVRTASRGRLPHRPLDHPCRPPDRPCGLVAAHDDRHASGPRGMAPEHCRRSRPWFRLNRGHAGDAAKLRLTGILL